MPDVFVSYSRKDAAVARRVHAALEAAGRSAWIDWEDIPPSADWQAEIRAAIEAADAVLLLLTPHSLASAECGKEIDHALGQNKRLVPVLAADVDPATVPDAQRRLNWIDVRGDAFDAGFAQLLTALDTNLDRVREHTRLLVRATEWQARGRERSLLPGGQDLRAAQGWLTGSHDGSPAPTALQTEYIVAGAQAESRRQRLTLGATLVALAVSATLAAWAWRERGIAQRQTQLAVANNLVVESRSEQHAGAAGAELRVLLGVEAVQRLEAQGRPTTEALAALDAAASLRARRLATAAGDAPPAQVAMAADGSRVVGWAGSKLVWRDTAALGSPQAITARASVANAALNDDGTLLAVGDAQGVWLQPPGDAAPRPLAGCAQRVLKLGFGAMGHVAALAAGPGPAEAELCVWQAASGRLLASERVRAAEPGDLATAVTWAFSADGRWFAAGLPAGDAWQLSLHALDGAAAPTRWPAGAGPPVIAFRGPALVVADAQAVWTWDPAARRETSRWPLDKGWRPLQASADGRWLTIGLFSGRSWAIDNFAYGVVGLFDSASGVQLAEMPATPHDFSPDSRHLVLHGADGSHTFAELPSLRAVRHVAGGPRLLVAGDGRRAVGAAADGTLSTWSLAEAPLLWQAAAQPPAAAWAMSADARWFVSAAGAALEVIDLLDAARTWRTVLPSAAQALAVSGDGRALAAVAGSTLLLWDLPALGRPRRVALGEALPPEPPCALLDRACQRRRAAPPADRMADTLRFSTDGRRVLLRGPQQLRAWSVDDGRPLLQTPSPPAAAWLGVGEREVVAREDGSIDVFAAPGEPRRITLALDLPLQRLLPAGGSTLVAVATKEATNYGVPLHGESAWTLASFDIDSGRIGTRRSGRGVLGPARADGKRHVVQTAGDALQIVALDDSPPTPVRLVLRQGVVQAVYALGFSADGRWLYVESETPITLGRSEPTLHVVDAATGAEVHRLPVRRDEATRLDRTAPYPEYFVVQPGAGLVAALEFENADQWMGLSAGRAKRDAVLWRTSATGALEAVFRKPVTEDLRPAALAAAGQVLVLAPMAGTATLQVWGLGPLHRLRRACAVVDGDLDAATWQQHIGAYTGEPPRRPCDAK